ncbi:MAG: hypothetical protein P8Z42_06970 [Anaerolineales bacterium]
MNETRSFFNDGHPPRVRSFPPCLCRLMGIAIFAVLTGCRAKAPSEIATPTPEPETPSGEIHTNAALALVEDAADGLPDEEPVDDQCIACHEDKQRLIDTAEPEEDVEVESSGEG